MSKSQEHEKIREKGKMYTNSWSLGLDFTSVPDEAVIETKMAAMRDGVELFNLIIKPKKEGRFPIILVRSPYAARYDIPLTFENYTALNPILASDDYMAFVADGYCLVYQHCRGTGNSNGIFQFALSDCDDACDTLDWIRVQDFYDGEIYRYGGSYLGMTSLIDASKQHKDVKGIVAFCPLTWAHEAMNRNGFFKVGLLGDWEIQTMSLYQHSGPVKVCHTVDTFRTFPQKDWGELIFGAQDPLYNVALNHSDASDLYWRSEAAPGHNMYASLEQLDIPTLFTTGWFDLFVEPLVKIWNEVIPEKTRAKSAFLITPYAHSFDGPRWQRWPYEMPGSTVAEYSPKLALNWFNHIRTGEPLQFVKPNRVTFFPELGQNKWYVENKFTNGENAHTLYLNENKKLETAPGNPSEITYLYNPYNPVSFYGGNYMRPGNEHLGIGNPFVPQDPPNWRYDVVSFEGEPFKQAITIKGGISADLHVKSDCEDTCFYVRLYLMRDGATYAIRDDIASLCHQLGDYKPGEEVKLHFEFAPIAWEIKPGDQLRIDVTSSCFPHFNIHTNIKGLQANIDKPKYAHNTLVFGKSSFTYHTSALSAEKYEIVKIE